MRVRNVIAIIAMLFGAICTKGQTYNCPSGGQETFNYALNTGGVTLTEPSQMTTVAATVNVGAGSTQGTTNLAPPSHSITVTPGTYILYQWKSYNAQTTSSWGTDNGTVIPAGFSGLNGSTAGPAIAQSQVGHTYAFYFFAFDASGHQTQDRIVITVVAGSGPSVVSSDNVYSNSYFTYAVGTSGGLTSSSCNQDQNHQAVYTAQLINSSSGESHSEKSATTLPVCPYCAIPYATVDSISMLPGDSVSVTNAGVTIKMNCTYPMFIASVPSNENQVELEVVFTAIKDLDEPPHPTNPPSGDQIYDAVNNCTPASSPPDWDVTRYRSDVRVDYGLGVSMCFRWAFLGPIWNCPANLPQIFWEGDQISDYVTMAVPWYSGEYQCTNSAKGYSGFPLQWSWPFPW